ncbi:hypothetical protein BS47DRAFT_1380668 [Hydnum rufescens UP504]|uniref:Uncharacterized protein n=1 Tax=Hydnum rufescens UP504 TaxID=1448309 RepID=A0A9P6B438_9AGAM|nr:hypothetical protein BS47DRAFT_1380668 [Hydnum rufescens UP504]
MISTRVFSFLFFCTFGLLVTAAPMKKSQVVPSDPTSSVLNELSALQSKITGQVALLTVAGQAETALETILSDIKATTTTLTPLTGTITDAASLQSIAAVVATIIKTVGTPLTADSTVPALVGSLGLNDVLVDLLKAVEGLASGVIALVRGILNVDLGGVLGKLSGILGGLLSLLGL